MHHVYVLGGFQASGHGLVTTFFCVFLTRDSNYWTAAMYFKHTNGSYKRVSIMQNAALPNGINGGMTIYYTQQDFNTNGNQKITSFPKVRVHSFLLSH